MPPPKSVVCVVEGKFGKEEDNGHVMVDGIIGTWKQSCSCRGTSSHGGVVMLLLVGKRGPS